MTSSQALADIVYLRKTIVNVVKTVVQRALGNQLRALILTGSMARDEGSFTVAGDCCEIFGDAEFLLVFDTVNNLPVSNIMQKIRDQIKNDLRQKNIRCTIDLGAVRPNYFRNLPAHIFSYELKHCGQVVSGDPRILELIPDFPMGNISSEDALRLLCNRLLEILEYAPELAREREDISSSLRYKIIKLYLDMATSFLVFVKMYAPGYRQRKKVLEELAAHPVENDNYPFDLPSFATIVSACTEEKLQTGVAYKHPYQLSWRAAIQMAHSLWRWELTQITGMPASTSDRELFLKWSSKQPFKARVRGWLYVVRACGWYRSYSYWPRWLRLYRKGSPRHLIYLAASTLLFELAKNQSETGNQRPKEQWNSLRRILPVNDMPANISQPWSFEGLASVCIWNYKTFLIGTRA